MSRHHLTTDNTGNTGNTPFCENVNLYTLAVASQVNLPVPRSRSTKKSPIGTYTSLYGRDSRTMNDPTLVAQLSIFAAIASFIWLVTRAFGKHNGWGIAVLFLSPISAVIYGVKYWKKDKLPFLAYTTTTITAIALCLYLFSAWGGWELLRVSQQVQQGIVSHTLTEQDMQSLEAISQIFDEHSGLDMQSSNLLQLARRELDLQARQRAAEEDAKAAATERGLLDIEHIARKTKPEQEHYRLTYVTIKVADARNYVGATVKVTRKNVVEKEYRLVKATQNQLEFVQRAGNGSYTFRFRNNDIEKIRVLTKQPY
jgi:hypothetical protein